MHTLVEIDCGSMQSFSDFHDACHRAFGFPALYGRTMDAWIDCMTSLDCPDDGMTAIHAPDDGIVVISLLNVDQLISTVPEVYAALVDAVAFVNYRKLEAGDMPLLALSYFAHSKR